MGRRDRLRTLIALLNQAFARWLGVEVRARGMPSTDYDRLLENLRLADVVLVEGRTRAAGVVQTVTLSGWSHSLLYVGRFGELPEALVDDDVRHACGNDPTSVLLIEAKGGEGVRLVPLAHYAGEHMRLCRASRLNAGDARHVVNYALAHIGAPYDLRHALDLLRFLVPYRVLPRRWRSTLFEMGQRDLSATICSTLIADAFASVRYPVLSTMHRGPGGQPVFHARDSKLITPRDFDFSPYFDVIKFPFFADEVARYRELVWD